MTRFLSLLLLTLAAACLASGCDAIIDQGVFVDDDEDDDDGAYYAEVEGAITSLDGDALGVEGVAFRLTARTDFEDLRRADLAIGVFVEVEGAPQGDDLVAFEVEAQDEDDQGEREMTASIDAVNEASITLLGQAIAVTDATDFEGFARLADLSVGDRVEVEFVLDGTTKRAVEIERDDEDDERDEDEDDEDEDDDEDDD